MSILPALFVAFVVAGPAVDAGGRPIRKPDLYIYIYTATWCDPCRAFKADLEEDRDFRAALVERYDVRIYDVERYRANATLAGVKSLPAFFAPGQKWEGYRGKEDLAARLRLNWKPPVAAPPAAAPPASATSSTDVALQGAYDRWLEHDQTMRSIDQRMTTLDARIDELAADRPAAIAEARAAAVAAVRNLTVGEPGRGVNWLGIVERVGVALGWTAPPALAAVGVARVVRTIFTARRRRRRAATPADPPPLALPVDPPEATPVVHTATRFQTVERDTFAEAHAWAVAQLGSKEPGATGTLVALDGLIAQYLSSKGAAHAVRK